MQEYNNLRAGLLALGIGVTVSMAVPAWAQYGAASSGVMVDLSVIDDGGMAAAATRGPSLPIAPQTGLVMPGPRMPDSTFIAPPAAAESPAITLKKPMETQADNGSSFTAPPPLKKPAATAAKTLVPAATPPAPKLTPSPKVAAPMPIKPEPKSEPVQTAVKAPEPTNAAPEPQKAKPLEPPAPPAVKKPPVTSEEVPPPPQMAKIEAPKVPMPLKTPEPEAEPAKEPVQVAAVSPKAPVESGDVEQVAFSGTTSKLPGSAKPMLDKLAEQIKGSTEMRLQVLAYAGGDNLSSSKARRLSLSRALAVRSYMIGQGVKSTRIDVRALGDKVPEGDPNRVDLKVVNR